MHCPPDITPCYSLRAELFTVAFYHGVTSEVSAIGNLCHSSTITLTPMGCLPADTLGIDDAPADGDRRGVPVLLL